MVEDKKYAGWKYYNFQKEIATLRSGLEEISRRSSAERMVGTLDSLLKAVDDSKLVGHKRKEELYRSLAGTYRILIEKL